VTVQFGIFDHVEQRPGASLRDLYEERIELLQEAECAGFYGYHLAEHHGHGLSLVPSQLVFLAALARETERLRLIPSVLCLPLHHPVRVVEEIAMVDTLSGGRVEVGVGRGVSPFEHLFFGHEPDEAKGRFDEALRLVMDGLTTRRMSGEGCTYYDFPEIELPIAPIQRPHPPFWYPGNLETAGRLGFNCISGQPITPELRAGYQRLNPADAKIGPLQRVVIASTDEQAERIARRAWGHLVAHVARGHGRVPPHLQGPEAPPSEPGLGRAMMSADPIDSELLVAGSPDRVRDYYVEQAKRGANYFVVAFPFGDMTHAEALATLRFFAAEVMPAVAELALEVRLG
jgi:alkanesulfonate monooxygenase SsuD/methylene tetrahydromethanopterin reductase-like flavin-dependent oxidoreductase (luciferase family)